MSEILIMYLAYFAHLTLILDSEAKIKVHIHCVAIGFSNTPSTKKKFIFTDSRPQIVNNING